MAVALDARVRWGAVIPTTEAIQGPNERVIELPLALEVMALDQPGWVLDAGCALNGPLPEDHPCRVVHVTQNIESEKITHRRNRAYVSADLRHLSQLFAPSAFDATVCVSTLEHVGLDNACYHAETESCPETMRQAVYALAQVTRHTLLITVPFSTEGKAFAKWRYVSAADVADLARIVQSYGFTVEARYYARNDVGWYGGTPEPVVANPYMENEVVNAIVAIRGVRE